MNKRIIEKDILSAVTSTEAGNSGAIDLAGASKYSCQAVYDVQAPTAKTFDSGGAEVDTATFDTQANTDSGDYLVIYDTAGLAWAVAADLTGSDPEPTGAVWVSIPAARKAQVDLSAAVTAANVAAAFEAAFNGLTDVPFVAADSTADVAFTQDLYGVIDAPEVHNEDDSGAGSISVVVTDAGVASEVNVADDEITIPSHGYPTGFKLQLTTTGTLPAGLALATDYFVISVDANTIQLASSLANALAGTAIDITDQGSDEAVNTATGVALAGASVTFQKSNDGTNWIDVQAATSITADGSVIIEVANVSYRYMRAVKALTSGVVDLEALLLVIGDPI
jgi:hypothetical protein